ILAIKNWLGTGSVNIFGLPMSGKDTVGVRLAELIGGKFLSSGLIIRANEELTHQHYSDKGDLTPTDVFYSWVLPYFEKEELKEFPLVLSSIGRWSGEEDKVMEAAEKAGHPIKVAVILNISEADVMNRWQEVATLKDRGTRYDDEKPEVFQHRIDEFRTKTAPVLLHYRSLGLLIEVRADVERDVVFNELIEKLYNFAVAHP
ncbi:nucleoside monophosphate kinase, partial [Candidatus Saccharibacteria bacterium]|nr:nucleoside monophosphate kinase [Candidatus Saccharibacteria bacterium]